MAFTFDDTMRAIWFRSGMGQDWMCGINELTDGTLVCQYRFRYDHEDSHPDEANSDKDPRHWYEMRVPPDSGKSLQDVIDAMQHICDKLGEVGFTPEGGVCCRLVRGLMTAQQFHDEFVKLPFVHLRSVVQYGADGKERWRA